MVPLAKPEYGPAPYHANELINGVCGVNPKSEGLIAYWKFDKSDNGRVIKDLTGNGRDAVATSNIKWVEGVKCSN